MLFLYGSVGNRPTESNLCNLMTRPSTITQSPDTQTYSIAEKNCSTRTDHFTCHFTPGTLGSFCHTSMLNLQIAFDECKFFAPYVKFTLTKRMLFSNGGKINLQRFRAILNQEFQSYQITTHIRVIMRCAHTAADQCIVYRRWIIMWFAFRRIFVVNLYL